MNKCFKKENQVEYHELSERTQKAMMAFFSPEQIEELSTRGVRTFSARFIVAGPVGYQEQNDITYISPSVLYRVAPTLENRAVIASPHDLNITAENIMQKAKGRVVAVWKAEDEDAWWARFEIWDEDLLKKIDDGKYMYVSCAYFITEDGGAFRYNGIDCTTNMLDGFMHHLAITDSPRFNDSDIWRLNEDSKNMLNVFRVGDIIKFNEDNNKAKEPKMGLKKLLGFKTNEVEVSDDVKFNTDAGEMTISEMIAKINEDTKTIAKLNEENAAAVAGNGAGNGEEEQGAGEQPKEPAGNGEGAGTGEGNEPAKTFAEKQVEADKLAAEGNAVKNAQPKEPGADEKVKVNEDGTVVQTVNIRSSMIAPTNK